MSLLPIWPRRPAGPVKATGVRFCCEVCPQHRTIRGPRPLELVFCRKGHEMRECRCDR